MSHPQPLPGNDTGGRERLQALEPQINAEHRACEEAVRSTLAHAINCGELLEKAKVAAGHGNWERWRDANFAGSAATAQLYQQLWRNREMLWDAETQRVRDLSLREARRIISGLDEDDDDSEGDSPEQTTPGKRESGKREGSKRGPGKPGRCDPPEPVIYSISDLPVSEDGLRSALREGRAVVLRSDAPAEAEKVLRDAMSFLEATVLAAWAEDRAASLLVVSAPDPASLAKASDTARREITEEGDDEEPTKEQIQEYERSVIKEVDKGRDERTVCQIIKDAGGIKPPPPDSDVLEEYKEIPPVYKNNEGLPGDEMAEYLSTRHPWIGIHSERGLIDFFARRRRGAA